jgi:hypothetical protein
MMHRLVGQVAFYVLLLKIDQDLAKEAWKTMCPHCEAGLHRANYPRTLRGAPAGLPEGFEKRFSFCCGKEGCRRRVTPPSVRFFGRRWTVAPVMVLLSALEHGPTPRRLHAIQRLLERPVPRRTLDRWRRWWREAFTASPFWKGLRGRFGRPLAEGRLPLSLIDAFDGDASTKLIATLELLRPVTTASWAHLAMGPTRR